jgi:transcriptional regulator with XRE-family HTH domain
MFAANRLRQAISDAGFTQEKFARECGVTLAAVQKWCGGKSQPTFENVLTVSRVLNTDPAYWVDNDDELEPAA